MHTPFKAIIFDMDGTLVDTLPLIYQALQETFLRYAGREYSIDEITAMFGPTEAGLIMLRVPDSVADQAVQYFYNRYEALHPIDPEPFPGILSMLKELRTRGIKTGIVTGKGLHTTKTSLKAYGLELLFDELATGSPTSGEKPQAIRSMLAGWEISPEEAAYVGDMASDMDAAHKAGVTAIGAGWDDGSLANAVDGLVFRSVYELINWLRAF